MKTVKTVIASTLLSFVFAAGAQATDFPIDASSPNLSSHEHGLVELCEALASGKKLELRRAMKSMRINYKELQEGLECNGQDPVTFAMLNNAEGVALRIAKHSNLDMNAVLASR